MAVEIMESHRHAGPKSDKYNELEHMIDHYYDTLRNKKRQSQASRLALNIRKHILIDGCPEDDIIGETTMKIKASNYFYNGPMIRKVEDTLRGKLWRLMLGVGPLSATDYRHQIKKEQVTKIYPGDTWPAYAKIRKDTERTFASSEVYNSRVAEERLIRVLNSYVQRYDKAYVQGMDIIAAGLLYVMPELDAYSAFSELCNVHFPTYYHSSVVKKKSLPGSFAASYLAWDVLKICDRELFGHLKTLDPNAYLFPVVFSLQAICKDFGEVQKLWDFLFCFGVHLNPIMAAAQVIQNKQRILKELSSEMARGKPAEMAVLSLLTTVLSQRNWMGGLLDSQSVIDCVMQCILVLKQQKHSELWSEIATHCSDFKVALSIKEKHENGMRAKYRKSVKSSSQKNLKDDMSNGTATTAKSTRNVKGDDTEQQ